MRGITSPGRRNQRRLALFLALAYLPALLYLGHLDIRLDLPGLGEDVALPLLSSGAQSHNHRGGTEEAAHRDHCHAASSSCGSSAQLTVAPVHVLQDQLLAHASDGAGRAVSLDAWLPGPGWTVAPLLPPPRPALAS